MANLNRNASFALKVSQGGYASIPSISELSFCGGQAFSITAQFYPKTVSGKISILQQNGTFDLGINNKYAYFTAKNLGNFSVSPDKQSTIIDNTWNTIAVSFTGSVIKIFVNSLPVLEKNTSGSPFIGDSPIQIGRGLEGYVQYIKIYQSALTDEQVAKDIFVNSFPIEKTAVHLDFNEPTPIDKGKNHLTISYYGSSDSKTALRVTGNGQVILPNNQEIQNLLGSNAYTAVFRIYNDFNETSMDTETGNLFFGGEPYKSKSYMSISLSKYFLPNGGPALFGSSHSFGEVFYGSLCSIENKKWLDIAVVYDGSSKVFKKYHDGICVYESQVNPPTINTDEIKIGGIYPQYNNLKPFVGMIDSVAFINRACSAKEIQMFVSSPPTQAENGLVSLYSFNDGRAIDKKSGELIKLSDSAILEPLGYSENCLPVNIVPALEIEPGGKVSHASGGEVNPANFTDGFTIHGKVYLPPQVSNQTQYLYHNGSVSNNVVSISRAYNNRAYFRFQAGGMAFNVYAGEYNTWVDYSLTYDRKNAIWKAYVDGLLKFTRGNAEPVEACNEACYWGGNAPSLGYYSYIAVWKKPLEANRLLAFVDNPPSLLDQDLAALYNFNQDSTDFLVEAKTNTKLQVTPSITMTLRENTQSVKCEPLKPIVPDDVQTILSKLEKWHAEIFAEMFIRFIKDRTGLEPDSGFDKNGKLKESTAKYIVQEVTKTEEFQNAIIYYDDTDSFDKFMNILMNSIIISATSAGLFALFYALHYQRLLNIRNILVKGVEVFVKNCAYEIIKYLEDKISTKPEPDPTPKPPQDKYRRLRIDAIAFNHGRKGVSSMNIKNHGSDRNAISAPEWNRGMKAPSQAAYTINEENIPEIDVYITYETNYVDEYTCYI